YVDFVAPGFVGHVRQPLAIRRKVGVHLVGGRMNDQLALAIGYRPHSDVELKDALSVVLALFYEGERRSVGSPRRRGEAACTCGNVFDGARPVGGPPIQVALTRTRAEHDPFSVRREDAVIALPIDGDWTERVACEVVARHLAGV